MRKLDIRSIARQPNPYRRSQRRLGALQRFPNLLQQNFRAQRPNQKWGSDITYVRIKKGFVYLAVIKDFGAGGRGVLSFPQPGITIALDIPIRADTQDTVDALNETVIQEGGRIYLTKDSYTRPEHFAAMEPRLDEFSRIRDKWDPERKFRSAQSVRLLGDSE